MNIGKYAAVILGFVVFVALNTATASPLTVSTYSMFNGGTGAYNYYDHNYTPCPASDCITTGAPLSGGTGELTDGVTSSTDWNVAGNPEPWVGWDNGQPNGTNPTVTFNFASTVTINSVSVWFDNTLGYGEVGAPGTILVDGVPYTPSQSTYGAQGFLISGLSITGNSVNVQFDQSANPTDHWIMIGEVSFNGSSSPPPVPEPSALFLTGSGLLGFLATRFRTRHTP